MDTCPICMDELDSETSAPYPLCKHLVHVKCMIEACQYSVRCPVCRTLDPTIGLREADTETRELEDAINMHLRNRRQFLRRRRYEMNRRPELKQLHLKLEEETRRLKHFDAKLEKAWNEAQRQLWRSDVDLNALKLERKRSLQRKARMKRQFDAQINELLGSEPNLVVSITTNNREVEFI